LRDPAAVHPAGDRLERLRRLRQRDPEQARRPGAHREVAGAGRVLLEAGEQAVAERRRDRPGRDPEMAALPLLARAGLPVLGARPELRPDQRLAAGVGTTAVRAAA